MAKAGPSTHILIELISELPGGFRDLQTINSVLSRYDAEIWEELTRRAPDNSGRWKYTYMRIVAWVPKENYHPLATSFGTMQKRGRLKINPSTYL